MSYIVKLSGCRSEGRDVSGEYDGGETLTSARKEAEFFASHSTGGTIRIVKSTNKGDSVRTVEWVRS